MENVVYLGHLFVLPNATPLPDKEQVLAYLRRCDIAFVSPGLDRDKYNPKHIIGETRIMTDGIRMWASDVSYYFEVYDAVLPADFLAHIRAQLAK